MKVRKKKPIASTKTAKGVISIIGVVLFGESVGLIHAWVLHNWLWISCSNFAHVLKRCRLPPPQVREQVVHCDHSVHSIQGKDRPVSAGIQTESRRKAK